MNGSTFFQKSLQARKKPPSVDAVSVVGIVNPMLAASCDIIALFGTAHLELIQRGRFQLQAWLPMEEITLISNAKNTCRQAVW